MIGSCFKHQLPFQMAATAAAAIATSGTVTFQASTPFQDVTTCSTGVFAPLVAVVSNLNLLE